VGLAAEFPVVAVAGATVGVAVGVIAIVVVAVGAGCSRSKVIFLLAQADRGTCPGVGL